jgi:hypothetical protein
MPDGLSSKAKQFFNMENKEEAVVKKTEELKQVVDEEVPAGNVEEATQPNDEWACNTFEFLMDTPKSMWDALGHMSFKFQLCNLTEAEARVDEVLGFFAFIKDKYADLFADADRVTPA